MKRTKRIRKNSAQYLKKKLGLKFTPVAIAISAPDVVRSTN